MPAQIDLPKWAREVAPVGRNTGGGEAPVWSLVPARIEEVAPDRRDAGRRDEAPAWTLRIEIDTETVTFSEIQDRFLGLIRRVASQLEEEDLSGEDMTRILVRVFDTLSDIRDSLWEGICDRAMRAFKHGSKIRELRYGSTTYPLRQSLQAQVFPAEEHRWTYSAEGIADRYVGNGDSIASARSDFLRKVHAAFQSLVQLREFQMSDEQLSAWRPLERLLDVEKYWESVPLTLLEVGLVLECDDDGRHVVWFDGHRTEYVPLDHAPPDFVALCKGSWFEALVAREPQTHTLRKVRFARRTSPLREMSEDELQLWLDGLPSGESLPQAESNWRTL